MRWASGEHEYTGYGFRNLVEARSIDILQSDLMYAGGLTEVLHIAALAGAYDVPVVPHVGGVYSYHFAVTQPLTPFVEYLVTSPKGDQLRPVLGDMFSGEPVPENGSITLKDTPGWGLALDREAVQLRQPYRGSENR